MFGRESKPSCIYRYDVLLKRGLEWDAATVTYLESQLGLCRLYRNKLIEIERQRRDRIEKARLALFPDYAAREAELEQRKQARDDLRDAIAAANQQARRKTTTAEQRAELRAIQAAITEAAARLKEMRDALWANEQLQTQLAAIEAENRALRLAARDWISNERGLYSYSYLGVEQSLSKIRQGPPPEFRRWNGSGRLCCQIQLGKSYPEAMTWERACLGADRRLRVRRAGKYHVVSVRLGSQGREPIWVDCPIVLHRPLPSGCVIKWVYLVRRKVGRDFHWSLSLVVSSDEGFAKTDLASGGRVAVDVGWRIVPGGVRVAFWIGQDAEGREEKGELIIPQERVDYFRKARDLQAIRDRHFNDIKARLAEYLGNLPAVPDWLRETDRYLHQIRSKNRLLCVLADWRRTPGDEDIYAAMAEWRRKEIHLERWESDQRTKYAAWRKDFYSRFWSDLRRKYARAVVEQMNVTELRRKPKPEEESNPAAIPYRNLASVGLLLSLATLPTRKYPAPGTTILCHVCQERCIWNAAAELVHTCEHCGATWDQDENACRNLLRQDDASGPVVNESPGVAREPEPAAEDGDMKSDPKKGCDDAA